MSKIAIFDVFDVKSNKIIIFIKILWQIFTEKFQNRIKLNFATFNIELSLFKYIILCDEKKCFTLTTFITIYRLIFLCFEIFDFEFEESFELLDLHMKENWYQTLCLILEYWRYVNKMMKSLNFKKTKTFNVDNFWFANDKA